MASRASKNSPIDPAGPEQPEALPKNARIKERPRRIPKGFFGDDTLLETLPGSIKNWRYDPTQDKIRQLELEIATLKQQFSEESNEAGREQLSKLATDITAKQKLNNLLQAVSPVAHDLLLSGSSLAEQFSAKAPCKAFVISIDIRKSTTLMFKAREPHLFASFITSLCNRFYDIILQNYGVFDKFTGDGILAFFPEFFSGVDAAFYALDAAAKCHSTFYEHYSANRHCFVSVLKTVGLGIGIDYGDVSLVNLWGGLTVVGSPVVYACRMGGAPPGCTMLNQPAFEIFDGRIKGVCEISEMDIDIKGEGVTLGYSVKRNTKSYTPQSPPWLTGKAENIT